MEHAKSLIYHLKLRNYTEATLEAYEENFKYFMKHYKGRKPSLMTIKDIQNYQFHLMNVKKLSPVYINQQICTVKFYFREVLNKKWEYKLVPTLKEPRNLPVVLSRNEVKRLLHAPSNIKHKTIFWIMYSTGMRPCELVKLQGRDIIKDDMAIFIRNGKGHKQRYVPLSPKVYELLRRYWKENKENKTLWLFPGLDHTKPMKEEAVSSTFRLYKKTQTPL
jgi:integrase